MQILIVDLYKGHLKPPEVINSFFFAKSSQSKELETSELSRLMHRLLCNIIFSGPCVTLA